MPLPILPCEPQPTRTPLPTLSGLRLFSSRAYCQGTSASFQCVFLCFCSLLCSSTLRSAFSTVPAVCTFGFSCLVCGKFREWNLVLRYWQTLCLGRLVLLDSFFSPLRVSSLCVQLCSIAFSRSYTSGSRFVANALFKTKLLFFFVLRDS